MSSKLSHIEFMRLTHNLAYATARSDIESYCEIADARAYKYILWDTGRITDTDIDLPQDIARAVLYLDARRLLVRDFPDHPEWVRILPEDSAQAGPTDDRADRSINEALNMGDGAYRP